MLKSITKSFTIPKSAFSFHKTLPQHIINNQLFNNSSQLNSFNNPSLCSHQRYYFAQKKGQAFKKKISKDDLFKAQQEELMKAQPDEDPNTYDKASGIGGRVFMGVGLLLMLGGLAYVQMKTKDKMQESDIDEGISGMVTIKQEHKVKVGGQWSLIDQKGRAFSTSDLAGSYYLIYFGFTKCPDICPATLIKLSRVIKLIRKMPENNYLNLKVIFVSCDPDRDNPKRMREYLKNFDEQIIGVTGTSNSDPQLTNCMKSFKIYANKIPLQNGQYSMDHTTITYLMDDSNHYVDHLNPNLTEQQMAKAIVNRILYHDNDKMRRRKKLNQE